MTHLLFASDPAPHSILAGADWGGILWALGWSALISYVSLRHQRRAQGEAGEERTSLGAILPEAILGAALGLIFSLLGPEWFPRFKTLAGVTALSMLGGFIGPPGWDKAAQLVQRYLGRRYGGDGDGQT